MILANVRRDVPPKVAHVGEKISLVAAGAMMEEAAAILLQLRIAHLTMSSMY